MPPADNSTVQPNAPAISSSIAIILLLVSSLTVMANATIAPSLPGLKDAFAGTPGITTLTGLAMTLPSLSVVLTAWLVGIAADRFEQRRLLIIGLIAYAVFGVSGAFAQNITSLLIGRVGLGIGVAVTMTLASTMIASLWQGPARQRFAGIQGAAMSGGGVVFLLAGGAAAALSWRAPFLLYSLALPIALAAWLILPLRPSAPKSTNIAATKLPMRELITLCAIAAFGMVMFYLVPTKLPFLLKELGIVSPVVSGAAIAVMTAASVPAALLFGRLRGRFEAFTLFAMSFAFMAAGYVLIAVATHAVLVFAGSLIAGFGIGALMPNLMSSMMNAAPREVQGKAAGLLTSAIFAGQFASPLISGPVADQFGLSAVYGTAASALVIVSIILLVFSRKSSAIA